MRQNVEQRLDVLRTRERGEARADARDRRREAAGARSKRGWARRSSRWPTGWSRCTRAWARCRRWPRRRRPQARADQREDARRLGRGAARGAAEQVLTPEQYARNVETRPGSNERVEFAIRLPGRGDDGEPCWLPIDAKFPREDYERLLEAQRARRRRGASRRAAQGARGALRSEAQDDPREVHRAAAHHRLRDPVPADRGPVRRGAARARAWSRRCSASTASCSPARRRCWRCSTACRWAFARWRSRSGRPRCGRCSARSRPSSANSATCSRKAQEEAPRGEQHDRRGRRQDARRSRESSATSRRFPRAEADRLLTGEAASRCSTPTPRPRRPQRGADEAPSPMFDAIARWRRQRVLAHAAIPDALWREAVAVAAVPRDATPTRSSRGCARRSCCSSTPRRSSARAVTRSRRCSASSSRSRRACSCSSLDSTVYDGFENVIVYPGRIRAGMGVGRRGGRRAHERRADGRRGDAGGPVVLSWPDVEASRGLGARRA